MAAGLRRWLSIPLMAMIAAIILPVQDLDAAPEKEPPGAEQADTVVARVNGQPIYQDRLAPQVQAELRRFRKFGAQKPPEELLKTLNEKALGRMITVELLYQASKNLEIPDVDERISKTMDEMRHRHASGLKDMSEAEIRESVRRQIYIQEYLVKNGLADPQIPETEIREYYEKNKKSFASTGSYRARHILRIVSADAKPEEREEARRQIEEARRLIVEGKPFAEVAREYSQCNTASAGGDLGPREKGYMPPEFEAVAFSIEPGKLSDIVETKFGFHILEVLERTPEGTVPSYEDARDFLTKFLKKERSREKIDRHVQQLRENAKIEVFLN
jgi:peptidyl-prolyl cis-trans isomerase C